MSLRQSSLSFSAWVVFMPPSSPGLDRPKSKTRPSLVSEGQISLDEGVPFIFKQWGGRTPKAGGRVLEGRTWEEIPEPAGRLEAVV